MATVTTTSSVKAPKFRRSDPHPVIDPHPFEAILRSLPAPSQVETVPPPQSLPEPPVAKKAQLVGHPLVQHAVNALRNKNTQPPQFRAISNQLLVLLVIEAARALPTREEAVETPTTVHSGQTLTKPVVFLSVARHGLGLSHAIADFIPGVLVGAISLERTSDNLGIEPRLHISNAPALSDVHVILFDPVVASGGSVSLALKLLRRSGATDISLISFLVSVPGLRRIHATFPDLTVWTAAIDRELDPKRGPLPGLGNFAERMYG